MPIERARARAVIFRGWIMFFIEVNYSMLIV
jgi:hypothetical protein